MTDLLDQVCAAPDDAVCKDPDHVDDDKRNRGEFSKAPTVISEFKGTIGVLLQ